MEECADPGDGLQAAVAHRLDRTGTTRSDRLPRRRERRAHAPHPQARASRLDSESAPPRGSGTSTSPDGTLAGTACTHKTPTPSPERTDARSPPTSSDSAASSHRSRDCCYDVVRRTFSVQPRRATDACLERRRFTRRRLATLSLAATFTNHTRNAPHSAGRTQRCTGPRA